LKHYTRQCSTLSCVIMRREGFRSGLLSYNLKAWETHKAGIQILPPAEKPETRLFIAKKVCQKRRKIQKVFLWKLIQASCTIKRASRTVDYGVLKISQWIFLSHCFLWNEKFRKLPGGSWFFPMWKMRNLKKKIKNKDQLCLLIVVGACSNRYFTHLTKASFLLPSFVWYPEELEGLGLALGRKNCD